MLVAGVFSFLFCLVVGLGWDGFVGRGLRVDWTRGAFVGRVRVTAPVGGRGVVQAVVLEMGYVWACRQWVGRHMAGVGVEGSLPAWEGIVEVS